MTETVIVTGGAGFIGSNLVTALIKRGYEVHVFDNLSTGNIKNIDFKKIKFYNLDLKNKIDCWPKIQADKIYHFAANADVRGGIKNHEIDFIENVCVTKNVCEYAYQNNIKNFIFASSATVYGEPNVFPTPENFVAKQTSLYGASKLSCESFIQAYSHYGYFKSSIFRFVSWVGKGYSHGVIYDFILKLLKDSSKLEILGDGNQIKSYLDVKDGVKGVIDISDLQKENTAVFNLGHNETMNVKDLANIVCEEMDLIDIKYFFSGGRRGWIGDSPFVHLDTNKAKTYGWEPEVKIKEGIINTVKFLLSNDSKRYR